MRSYYSNLSLFRIILACFVFYEHVYALAGGSGWHIPIMAVPSFLGISGYLVLESINSSPSWRHFAEKRIRRIVPALTASLLLCWALLGFQALVGSVVVWATGSLVFPDGQKNFALWSLAWEEVAYTGLIILWGIGAYKNAFWIWICLVLSIVLAAFLSYLPPHQRIILFLFPAFFVGNLLYIYRNEALRVHPLIPWLALVLLWQWGDTPGGQLFGGVLVAVVQPLAIVWAGMAGAQIIPVRYPDLSYGIYVYHLPVIFFILNSGWVSGPHQTLAVAVPLVLALSALSWYLLEKPAIYWRRSGRSFA
nr:acyltransferase [Mesorhizobium loti]